MDSLVQFPPLILAGVDLLRLVRTHKSPRRMYLLDNLSLSTLATCVSRSSFSLVFPLCVPREKVMMFNIAVTPIYRPL